MTMKVVNEVISVVREHIDRNTNLTFNAVADDTLEDRLQVSIILVPIGGDAG